MPRLAPGIRLLIAASCLVPAAAAAQPAGNLPIDTFRPAIDSRGYLTINASQPLGHGEVSFGLGSLSWGRGLLALEEGDRRYSVDNVVTATLGAAFGLHLGPLELELGASLPLSVVSGDRGPDDPGMAGDPNDDKDYRLDGQGLGNAGLHLKTRLVRSRHVGVGLIASLYLPTANRDRFMGDGKAVPQLVGIVDRELAGGRLRLALNGGVRLRGTTSFTDTGDMGAPSTNQTVAASAELPFGVGAAWAVAPGRFEVIGEVFGAVPLAGATNYQPLEALAGVKLYLARNSFLSLGAGRGLAPAKGANPDARAFIGIVFEPSLGDRDGDGIKDDVDRCPAEPEDHDGFEDRDGCPEPDVEQARIPQDDGDRDGDSIRDQLDKCPDDPEDFDQFEDGDGCPELDNDGDKIIDLDDLCPMFPEDVDGDDDTDGCPDDRRGPPIVVVGSTIELKQPINFEFDKAIIKPDSFYILDAVVDALQSSGTIKRLRIAGHTDEQGDADYNLDLSIRRAAAVRDYLVDKGVKPERLESQGYGETQPINPRHTQAAYARNRRVEFIILDR
jgi:outer membrane protein OmpA-like peptidoglycan-associated protein